MKSEDVTYLLTWPALNKQTEAIPQTQCALPCMALLSSLVLVETAGSCIALELCNPSGNLHEATHKAHALFKCLSMS